MDIVRVLRIVEYTGPRNRVEFLLERSIHGTKVVYNTDGDVAIRVATIGTYPEILEREEDKEDKSET